MVPPPGRRRPPHRAAVAASVLILLLSCSACGLPSPPGAPGPTVSGSPILRATQTPTASTSTATSPARPAELPSYPVPTEPACAVPGGTPTSTAGAGGPTLTARRVEKAWRNSEAGRNLGVKTGKVADLVPGEVTPSRVVAEPGAPWVALDIMEWSSVTTIVLANPDAAAAKLAAVRAMLRKPCSYRYGGPYVVAHLSEDRPDLVQVTGTLQGLPITDTFVRYGNTVTYASMTMVPQKADEIRALVLGALAKA